MSDVIAPSKTVKFTITKTPRKVSLQKTMQRLMQMQPESKRLLKALQKQRRQHDNNTYVRAGVWWTDRARATRVTRVEVGESFTLRLTPQIINDVNAILPYVDAKAG